MCFNYEGVEEGEGKGKDEEEDELRAYVYKSTWICMVHFVAVALSESVLQDDRNPVSSLFFAVCSLESQRRAFDGRISFRRSFDDLNLSPPLSFFRVSIFSIPRVVSMSSRAVSSHVLHLTLYALFRYLISQVACRCWGRARARARKHTRSSPQYEIRTNKVRVYSSVRC